MSERTVIFRGDRVRVSVSRLNKVWTARGEICGHVIEAEGRRDRSAVARWLELAEMRAA